MTKDSVRYQKRIRCKEEVALFATDRFELLQKFFFTAFLSHLPSRRPGEFLFGHFFPILGINHVK
jgi:hypothetical protein